MSSNKSLATIAPLFLVLCLDGMGLGLLFPILNSVIIDPSSAFLDPSVSALMRNFLYGLTVGIFMLCWFFGATILGDLSDTTGRKKALMICLIGAFFGYFISAIGILATSLPLLIVGRVIAGFTAGSQPIAQAAIVDISSEEDKARNIGWILLSVSIGFVIGPILGGILSDPRIVSWFGFATPLYFASIVSLLNAVLLWFLFHETFHKTERVSIKLSRAVTIFISAFKHADIWHLSLVMTVMIVGWSSYFTFSPMYLFYLYHFSTLQNSLYLAVLGLGFSVGCGSLVGYFTHRYRLKAVTTFGLFFTAAVIAIQIAVQQFWMVWLAAFLIGAALSTSYSSLITMFSNEVSSEEQGWVMGVTGSIMALCFGLTSLLTGFAAQLSATLPMLLAIAGIGGSALILHWLHLHPISNDAVSGK